MTKEMVQEKYNEAKLNWHFFITVTGNGINRAVKEKEKAFNEYKYWRDKLLAIDEDFYNFYHGIN